MCFQHYIFQIMINDFVYGSILPAKAPSFKSVREIYDPQ